MPTQKEQYFKQLADVLKNMNQRATVKQQKQIMQIYIKAFNDSYNTYLDDLAKHNKQPNERMSDKCKLQYINQIYKEIQKSSILANEEIPKSILEAYAKIIKDNSKNETLNSIIDENIRITSREIVESMIKGSLYKNSMGLSSRLWVACTSAGERLDEAIQSCFARGLGAADSAQIIKQFAKEGHHTWDRTKIREKLGPGYAAKYGRTGLDYESLRLMRTTNTHMSQLAAIHSARVNPYSNGVIYHNAHTGNRVCPICRDRNGKFYKLDEVPLDHPNGGCWFSPFLSVDGKNPATLGDIVDDMNNKTDEELEEMAKYL